MHVSVKIKKVALSVLIILSLTMCISTFLPKVIYAADATVLTISPTQGKVGDIVHVEGTIETSNGNFTIFFDLIKVNSSFADGAGRFVSSFHVPHAKNGTHNVTLQDVTLNHNDTKTFTVITSYNISAVEAPKPKQHQEGSSIAIVVELLGADSTSQYPFNVTVTTPANTTFFNHALLLSTDENGSALTTLNYPIDFQPAGAHTNYTGTYNIYLFKNATTTPLDHSNFVVGLTNATLYQRLEWVNIKATNYTKPNENATITIKFGNNILLNVTKQAENGTITHDWQVPVNASKGSYKVVVKTAIQNGTIKPVLDTQNFTVPGLSVQLLTTNLNGEPLSGVNATAYRIYQDQKQKVAADISNSSGWAVNILDRGGNYTFKAFWKNMQVNETSKVYIESNSTLNITCQITHIEFTVIDEKTGNPMPRIYLTLSVRYLTVLNTSITEPPQEHLTNVTGKWRLYNQLVNANYTLYAFRTQLQFLNETFTIPQDTKWFYKTITCPLRNFTIHAEDAKQTLLGNHTVKIYEYGGGLYDQGITNATTGNVTFSCTFGIYKVRLYDVEQKIILNETYYNLIEPNAFLVLRSNIYHADLTVKVLDYLGQPIPNAKVKLERESITPVEVVTDGNGVAFFEDIIGGNCFISIYIGSDSPSETANIYVEKSTTTTIALEKYIVVFGIVTETTHFAVSITLIILIALFAFFLFYRWRRQKTATEKTAENLKKQT